MTEIHLQIGCAHGRSYPEMVGGLLTPRCGAVTAYIELLLDKAEMINEYRLSYKNIEMTEIYLHFVCAHLHEII